jgi:hypothetical protein
MAGVDRLFTRQAAGLEGHGQGMAPLHGPARRAQHAVAAVDRDPFKWPLLVAEPQPQLASGAWHCG